MKIFLSPFLFLVAAVAVTSAVENVTQPNMISLNTSATCILGTQTGCNTGVAYGLSMQIVLQLQSMGRSFKPLDPKWIQCKTPCFPALQSAAADSLAAVAMGKKSVITLNSAFRSAAQQYLLYSWYKKGICGIPLAAEPGSSNHEGGRAVDLSNINFWLAPLQKGGWTHTYPSSDPVHFDYPKAADLSSTNLLAFQKLWNKHNPSSRISEDGAYGPNTAKALSNAPCNGW